MKWSWLAVVVGLCGVAKPASAELKPPSPLGARARVSGDPGAGVEFGMLINAASADGVGMGHLVASIGGGSGLTGTFALNATGGLVLGRREPTVRGLALRSGVDILVDSLGDVRLSQLSLPVLQASFVDASSSSFFDVGLDAAPVWLGRLRHDDVARSLAVGVKAGPHLVLSTSGVWFRLDVNDLVVSSSRGGGAVWSRGLLCFGSVVALCAEGSHAWFEPSAAGPAQNMGYVGVTFGFDVNGNSNYVTGNWGR